MQLSMTTTQMVTRARPLASKNTKIGGRQLPSRPIAIIRNSGPLVAMSWLPDMLHHSLASFVCQIGCQPVPRALLIPMVPSVRYESDWIINTLFYAKTTKFVS